MERSERLEAAVRIAVGGRGVMDTRTESASLISREDVPEERKGSRNGERSLGG